MNCFEEAVALYDFEAQESDELSFIAGDTLVILQRVNEAWCMGKRGEKIGIFPTSYVEVIQDPRQKSLSQMLNQSPDIKDGALEVVQWLATFGMEKHAKAFVQNGFDDIELMDELTAEDLDDIGLVGEADRKAVLQAAMSLRNEGFENRPLSPEENGNPDPDAGDSASVYGFRSGSGEESGPELEPQGTLASEPPKKKKAGFLHIQDESREWRPYWVNFEAGELKYYHSQEDPEPAGVLLLDEIMMVATNEFESKIDPHHPHCFEIMTSRDGMVFLFSAETDSDSLSWVQFIEFLLDDQDSGRPSSTTLPGSPTTDPPKRPLPGRVNLTPRVSEVPGGFDDPPEKHGWLKKMGNNMAKDWKRRYVAIKNGRIFYYRSYEAYLNKDPINFIEALTTSVKPAITPGRYRFELVTLNRSYWFQAESQAELMDWVLKIQETIGAALTTVQSQKAEKQAQTGTGPSKFVSGAIALATMREIESNRFCAECQSADPDWASINLGIVICIECSGIHRSLGVQTSKVRSLPLDEWHPELIKLMQAVGNKKANAIWQGQLPEIQRITPNHDREAKKDFIISKYINKKFLSSAFVGIDQATLDQKLFENVKTENLLETIELIACGANLQFVDPERGMPVLHAAAQEGHLEQIELLLQNGVDPLATDLSGARADEVARKAEKQEAASWIEAAVKKAVIISETEDFDDEARNKYRCGYLFKRGESNKFWKRRWFVFDEDALRYFKLKEDREPAGVVLLGDMVSISAKEDHLSSKPNYFELESCIGRTYELAADNQSQMLDWLDFLRIAIDTKNVAVAFSPVNFDLKDCEMHGFLNKKVDSQKSHKSRWFLLKGKTLYFFKDDQDRELLGSIDLRLVTQISRPTNDESRTKFSVTTPNRTYHFESRNQAESEAWQQALINTQTFGVPLEILAKRKQGSHDKNVPLVLVKCLYIINAKGLELENLFKKEGDPAIVQRLKTLFDQDELSVALNSLSPTSEEVYSIAHLIKVFFMELPEPLFPLKFNDNLIHLSKIEDSSIFAASLEEALKQFPDPNIRTLKKLLSSLQQVSEKSSSNHMDADALAQVFAPLLFPRDQPSAQLESWVLLLRFLINNYKNLFQNLIPDNVPRKPMRPTLSSSFQGNPLPQADILELEPAHILEVTVDDLISFTFPVNQHTPTKELIYHLVKRVVAQFPNNLCSNYSIFEVTPEFERPLTETEPVLAAVLAWAEPAQSKLVFKRNPVVYLISTMHETFPEMTGWLYKEGVTVKSWKKRYFVLRPAGLFYYREPNNINSEKGFIPYHDLSVYILPNYRKAPTKYCFALRHKSYRTGVSSQNPDVICRVLSAETAAERDSWMAAISRAKTFPVPPPSSASVQKGSIRKSERSSTLLSFDSSRLRSRPRLLTADVFHKKGQDD